MGETLSQYKLVFNKSVSVEIRGERITTEAGTLLTREVLEQSGVLRRLKGQLQDTRDPTRTTHPVSELLATALLLFCQGWRDQDDADALRNDSAFQLAVSTRTGAAALNSKQEQRAKGKNAKVPCGLASQPTLSRLVRMLSTDSNQNALRNAVIEMGCKRISRESHSSPTQRITIDVDSLPISVEGHQLGSEYNGHYHERIFHPLIASVAETGDILAGDLRPGNVPSAFGAKDFILNLVDKVKERLGYVPSIRMDAGFPEQGLLSSLEDRGVQYVARIKNNSQLDSMAGKHYQTAANAMSGVTSGTCMVECEYKAAKWSRARRVVVVFQKREGELLLHHFCLVTSWCEDEYRAEDLLEHYRTRGIAEGIMGELMDVLKPALSSTNRPKSRYRNQVPKKRYASGNSFAQNEVLMLLNLLAYETIHTIRKTLQKATKTGWSIKRTQERVLRVGARILLHARQVTIVIEKRAGNCWEILLEQLRKLAGPAPAS
jgi:hypothetical protein